MRITREEFLECYEKVYVCGEKDKRKALEFLDFLGKGNVLNITPNELWDLIDDTLDFILGRKIEKEAETKTKEEVAEIKETETKVIYNFYFN